MQTVRLTSDTDIEGWRNAARALLLQEIAPEHIQWRVGQQNHGLFDRPEYELIPGEQANPRPSTQLKVPREFIALCRQVILHRDPSRFALLYRLLWRLKAQPKLLQLSVDPDVAKAQAMVKAVRRDLHKMKAFVRFREIEMENGDSEFVAWFEPSHHIVEASAPFFTGRFTNMRWSILTPEICMHWDGQTLNYTAGASKADAPAEDAGEELWRSYYRSIFNPARLKVSAMLAQMPKKYWRNLPEAPLIAELIADSSQRMHGMIVAPPTEPQRKIVKYVTKEQNKRLPADAGEVMTALRELNDMMLSSADFPLAGHARQAVLGQGVAPATILLLGEQPQEQDDLAGQPFTGQAGTLLDQALNAAGIGRSDVYATNVLKHYKYKLQGRRRIPLTLEDRDIQTYLPWLRAEIEVVQPSVIVAFGPIAARALTGKGMESEAHGGKLLTLPDDRQLVVTIHPALILSIRDQATKQLRSEQLMKDLALAAKAAMQRALEKG
jgi:uracil-DNA glycosylase